MGRISSFVLGTIVGGSLMFGSLHYHVLRATDGFYLIPKVESNFQQTYVDIRAFGITEWNRHKSLAAAIVKAHKQHLLTHGVAGGLSHDVRQTIDRASEPGA